MFLVNIAAVPGAAGRKHAGGGWMHDAEDEEGQRGASGGGGDGDERAGGISLSLREGRGAGMAGDGSEERMAPLAPPPAHLNPARGSGGGDPLRTISTPSAPCGGVIALRGHQPSPANLQRIRTRGLRQRGPRGPDPSPAWPVRAQPPTRYTWPVTASTEKPRRPMGAGRRQSRSSPTNGQTGRGLKGLRAPLPSRRGPSHRFGGPPLLRGLLTGG